MSVPSPLKPGQAFVSASPREYNEIDTLSFSRLCLSLSACLSGYSLLGPPRHEEAQTVHGKSPVERNYGPWSAALAEGPADYQHQMTIQVIEPS